MEPDIYFQISFQLIMHFANSVLPNSSISLGSILLQKISASKLFAERALH